MSHKKIMWAANLGFVAVGIISSIIGPLLPSIRAGLGINYSQAGLLLSGQFIGMLPASLLGGWLIDHYGKKPVLMTGSGILLTGLIGSMVSGNFILLYTLNLLTGVGFGIYEVTFNALCADNVSDNKGDDMNMLHSFYGIGAISGPAVAALCASYFNSWRLCFGLAAVLPVVVTFMVAGVQIPRQVHAPAEHKEKSTLGPNPFKHLFIWMTGLTIFFYVGVEVSTGGWLPEFWKATVPDSRFPAALATTIFWIAITLGRMVSGKIADKIGLTNYLVAAASGTMVLALVWALLPFGFGMLLTVLVMGFFLAGQFPTMMVVATSHFPGRSGIVAAFISVFASIGGFVIPPLIGKIADTHGIRILSVSVLISSIFLVVFMFAVRHGYKKIKTWSD